MVTENVLTKEVQYSRNPQASLYVMAHDFKTLNAGSTIEVAKNASTEVKIKRRKIHDPST